MNTKNYKKIITLYGHSHDVNSVSFSPNGKILVSASDDNTIKLWDTKTYKQVARFKDVSIFPISIFLSSNKKSIIFTSEDQTIILDAKRSTSKFGGRAIIFNTC